MPNESAWRSWPAPQARGSKMATKKRNNTPPSERASADALVPDYLRGLPWSRSADDEDSLQDAALRGLEAGDGKLRPKTAKRQQQRDRENERHLLTYGAAPMRQRRQWRVNDAPSLGAAMSALVDFVHQDGGAYGLPDVVASTLARWIPRFLPELPSGDGLADKVLESLRAIPTTTEELHGPRESPDESNVQSVGMRYEFTTWPYQAVRRALIAAGMTVREADDALNAVQQRQRRDDRAVMARLEQFVDETFFRRGGLTARRWLALDETTGEIRPVSLLSAEDAKRIKTRQRVRKHRDKKR